MTLKQLYKEVLEVEGVNVTADAIEKIYDFINTKTGRRKELAEAMLICIGAMKTGMLEDGMAVFEMNRRNHEKKKLKW